MASKRNTSGFIELGEQLTCPVCYELYTNPRALPCQHALCKRCLERLPQDKENETYYLSCPTCRQRIALSKEGVEAFPVAFQINKLLDIHNLMEQDQQIQPESLKERHQDKCSEHGGALKIFCETCATIICAECGAVGAHRGHKYESIDELYPKSFQLVENHLTPVKAKVDEIKTVLSAISKMNDDTKERGEKVLEDINKMVGDIISRIHRSEKKLTEQVKRITDAKLEELSNKTQIATAQLNRLKDVESNVEQCLNELPAQELVASKKQLVERLSKVNVEANVDELIPGETADLRLIKDSNAIDSLHHIGDIVDYSSTALQECKVKMSTPLEYFPKEEELTFSLSIEALDSSLKSVKPMSTICSIVGRDDQPIHTTVTSTKHPGVYRIYCKPLTNGSHTLKMEVDGIKLQDTSLAIPINPCLNNFSPVPVDTFDLGNNPWRAAVSDNGDIIVTECGNNRITKVTKLDTGPIKITAFGGEEADGKVEFVWPRGVVITPDNDILVSDDHRIQKIKMNGECIGTVGEYGSEKLQFNQPDGLAISPITGLIYIADTSNNRIQVLGPDFDYSHSFGSGGSNSGQFNAPSDIAIDSRGFVYVADTRNNRIQKFTPDGRFLDKFPNKSVLDMLTSSKFLGRFQNTPLKMLNFPMGIAIDAVNTNLVYVTDKTNRITVLTTDCSFVRNFGSQSKGIYQFNAPTGVTFKDKHLCICDTNNHSLAFY